MWAEPVEAAPPPFDEPRAQRQIAASAGTRAAASKRDARVAQNMSVADARLVSMSTQYYTASSIDGFIADSDNSLSWLFQFSEPSGMEDEFPRFIATVGAIAMGSTTYEWIANHTGFLSEPSKWEYAVPTWVFSSRDLPRAEGLDIRFVSGNVAPVHQEMLQVAEGRNIWLVGGGDLVGQFHDQGLLDEVIIGMASVTLGSGAPLLPRRIVTPPLQLIGATQYGADFVMLRYAVRNLAEPE
jgi:dihydrofolate reductase